MRIVNRVKFIRSTTILIFLLLAFFNICVAKSDKETAVIDYIISPGETLWTIAEEYKADKEDTREYIYNIKKLNNMKDSNIYAGQTIKIKKEQ